MPCPHGDLMGACCVQLDIIHMSILPACRFVSCIDGELMRACCVKLDISYMSILSACRIVPRIEGVLLHACMPACCLKLWTWPICPYTQHDGLLHAVMVISFLFACYLRLGMNYMLILSSMSSCAAHCG